MSSGIGFITESQIEEKKKARQEEWERVRKPEEPLEVPEEQHDGRSLFDRLQEQKNMKQEEFEESRRLKNLVKVLDDDECEFLDYIDQVKIDEDKRKRIEEAKELKEFRDAVSKFNEKNLENAIHHEIFSTHHHIHHEGSSSSSSSRIKKLSECDEKQQHNNIIPSIGIKRISQSQLLSGLVKKKPHLSIIEHQNPTTNVLTKQSTQLQDPSISLVPPKHEGILPPGLVSYGNSSSSDSDESDQEK